jgi:uncharacterized membrane protein
MHDRCSAEMMQMTEIFNLLVVGSRGSVRVVLYYIRISNLLAFAMAYRYWSMLQGFIVSLSTLTKKKKLDTAYFSYCCWIGTSRHFSKRWH